MDYPRGFWSEEKNFWSELKRICEELGHFPSASYLNKNGCSAALPYIQKAGGFEAVSTKLGFDTRSEVLEKKKQEKLEKAQEKEEELPEVKLELEPEDEVTSETAAAEILPEDSKEVFVAPVSVSNAVLLAEPVVMTEEAKELIDSALVAYHKFLPVIEAERKVKEVVEEIQESVSQPNYKLFSELFKVLEPMYKRLKEVPRKKYLLENGMLELQKAIEYHGGRDSVKDKLLVMQVQVRKSNKK